MSPRLDGRRAPWTVAAGCLLLIACQPEPEPAPQPEEPPAPLPDTLEFLPASWDALPGWAEADLADAQSAFLRSCERLRVREGAAALSERAAWAGTVADWREACTQLDAVEPGSAPLQPVFEAVFTPVRVVAVEPESGTEAQTGMMTGYYEPFVHVRPEPGNGFTQPLRRRPDDLVTVDLGRFDPALAGRRIVGEVRGGELVLYKDRGEIERLNAGEIFAWGRPADVFFLQIQGSGRLVWPDGHQERAAFAAHNGLPYRSIGRELIERGELEAHAASKAGIEAWLEDNGPQATAELFAVNPRYVFFQTRMLDDPAIGPSGSAGVPLTPMASIAVDPSQHAYGVPVWLSADLPELGPWSGLVVTQDTGGAITGPLRVDFFWGWGEAAERRAGSTRAQAEWVMLLPHTVVARLFAERPPA
ncbi:murein transglycosylase A [Maricaulis sp.]|uniref:murein transglycosylase A n=1 Tax=Maricaulis sp. TaxID=1486257 RepID=UPI0025C44A18|nr:MltA domain-containing protein [Maricaulis sp.]